MAVRFCFIFGMLLMVWFGHALAKTRSSVENGQARASKTPAANPHGSMSAQPVLPSRVAMASQNTKEPLIKDLKAVGLAFGSPLFLRAYKEEKLLEVFVFNTKRQQYQWFRSYPIAACNSTPGPKLAEGDGRTPEGVYGITPQAMNPNSQYHLSMNIGYPNAYDRSEKRTGSWIMIHGNQISIGCLAMTDPVIEELYTLVRAAHQNGQAICPVHLFPFRMTPENLAKQANSPWLPFWQSLQKIDQAFEASHVLASPPDL